MMFLNLFNEPINIIPAGDKSCKLPGDGWKVLYMYSYEIDVYTRAHDKKKNRSSVSLSN